MDLNDIVAALNGLEEKEKAALIAEAQKATEGMRFIPLPGPQTDAYLSPADVLLFGGQAGGGKSFLLMGLASQEHQRSIVFRRESSQTDGLVEAGRQIIGDTARFNGSDAGEWNWTDGKNLKLAGMKEPGDWNKHAGRERDFIGFDEGLEFLEAQVASMLAWNRGPEGQRCRVVLASNPPRTADGAWVFVWFAPWLDPGFPMPAKEGELRYAVMVGGKPQWRDGPEPVEIDGEMRTPLSFTFIRSKLADNPYRNTPEYRARIDSLPEPLRSQLKHGLFRMGGEDDPWQLMPTQWVQAAMDRWTEQPPEGAPQCAIGVDVAQGGADNTVLAIRHDGWYAPLLKVPGIQTPGGTDVAGLVIAKRRDNSMAVVDIGGGWGGEAYAHLKANSIECEGYLGVKESDRRTEDNNLKFFNVRAEAYWRFREALNPDQPGGSHIMLPKDLELLAELCCPTFDVTSGGIKVLPKDSRTGDSVKKRLGRSPDKADAVVMAWFAGPKMASHYQAWKSMREMPKVNLGRSSARRRYR